MGETINVISPNKQALIRRARPRGRFSGFLATAEGNTKHQSHAPEKFQISKHQIPKTDAGQTARRPVLGSEFDASLELGI